MWRSLFFAIGSALVLMGVQCLVVDHFVVANGTRVPTFVAKFLEKSGISQPGQVGASNPSLGFNSQAPQVSQFASNNFRSQNRSTPFPFSSNGNSGSRFGPSRFADSQFSNSSLPPNSSFYGGRPSSGFGAQSNASNFSMASFNRGQGANTGVSPVNQGAVPGNGTVSLGSGPSKLIRPSDWMPWGLLAIGTLVILYTNSTNRRYSSD